MGLFGKKNNNNDNDNEEIKDATLLQGDDLDAFVMSAIEEAEFEQEQQREEEKKNEEERIRRQTLERNGAARQKKMVVRRFFLMVTSAEEADGAYGLKGSVHGLIKKDDKVYVYRPNGTVLEGKVEGIETESDEKVDEIKSQVGRLIVRFDSEIEAGTVPEEAVPFYSVVTCVKPVDKEDNRAPVENPYLLGLSLEYKNYMKDKQYMRLLIKNIADGKFIVPIHPAQPSPDGGKPIIKLVTLKKSPDDKLPMVPLFTDIAALSSWKELFEKEGKPSVAMLSFKELAKNTQSEGPDFVLNPSGPLTINFPRDVVNNIAGLVTPLDPARKSGKQRIAIGVPPKNDETEAIRKALVEFASNEPSIKALGYIATIKEMVKGYACVVDCPKEGSRELFQQMAEKIKPYMKEVRTMEFMLRAEAPFAEAYFSKIPYDYKG
ncbi:SseB protein N-terminal domain-containing protein [Oscillospiraceae bacterium]|nr:SseB protein N-terminal domain-containing protein [Oscillospiraceae bacterium]